MISLEELITVCDRAIKQSNDNIEILLEGYEKNKNVDDTKSLLKMIDEEMLIKQVFKRLRNYLEAMEETKNG